MNYNYRNTTQEMFLLKNITQHKQFAAIEILQIDEAYRYALLILERNGKEEVKIREKHIAYELTDFEPILKKETLPLFVAFEIKGVLHRSVSAVVNGEAALSQVLPNAKPNDFYTQSIPMSSGTLVSIVRQETLDVWWKQFEDLGFCLLGIALGPFVVETIVPFIKEKHFSTSSYQLWYDEEGRLQQFEQADNENTNTIDVSGEALEDYFLTPLALAFNGIDGHAAPVEVEVLAHNKKEYQQRQLFLKGGMLALGLCLFVLMINTFFYFSYKNEKDTLRATFMTKQSILTQLDTLEQRLGQFQQNNLSKPSKASFFADQIASTLPRGMQLTAMVLFPLDGRPQDYMEESEYRYQENKLQLKGRCKNGRDYDGWRNQLQKLDFVQEVLHLNYKDLDNQVGEFEMEINLK